ncbi:hypothetical protein ACJX0J_042027, partial [Zea mays]
CYSNPAAGGDPDEDGDDDDAGGSSSHNTELREEQEPEGWIARPITHDAARGCHFHDALDPLLRRAFDCHTWSIEYRCVVYQYCHGLYPDQWKATCLVRRPDNDLRGANVAALPSYQAHMHQSLPLWHQMAMHVYQVRDQVSTLRGYNGDPNRFTQLRISNHTTYVALNHCICQPFPQILHNVNRSALPGSKDEKSIIGNFAVRSHHMLPMKIFLQENNAHSSGQCQLGGSGRGALACNTHESLTPLQAFARTPGQREIFIEPALKY